MRDKARRLDDLDSSDPPPPKASEGSFSKKRVRIIVAVMTTLGVSVGFSVGLLCAPRPAPVEPARRQSAVLINAESSANVESASTYIAQLGSEQRQAFCAVTCGPSLRTDAVDAVREQVAATPAGVGLAHRE